MLGLAKCTHGASGGVRSAGIKLVAPGSVAPSEPPRRWPDGRGRGAGDFATPIAGTAPNPAAQRSHTAYVVCTDQARMDIIKFSVRLKEVSDECLQIVKDPQVIINQQVLLSKKAATSIGCSEMG